MPRHQLTLASTTSAVDWDIFLKSEFNVPRIDLTFTPAPSSAGYLYIKKEPAVGTPSVIRFVSPVGYETMAIEGLHGFSHGDKVVIEYANPDGVTITGTANTEIPVPTVYIAGMSLDDGSIRSKSSSYRRYYHVPISSANPGASGATWVNPSSTRLRGWQLNTPTENITASTDIHADWDTSTNPDLEVLFTVNVDNTAGTATDVVDFQVVCYYGAVGDAALKTQTITGSATVGACAQYARFKEEIDLDRNAASNPIAQGDVINMIFYCLGTGDVTDVTVNDVSFYYNTTHVGVEAGDV